MQVKVAYVPIVLTNRYKHDREGGHWVRRCIAFANYREDHECERGTSGLNWRRNASCAPLVMGG